MFLEISLHPNIFFFQMKNDCILYYGIRPYYIVYIFYELFSLEQLVHLLSFAVIAKRAIVWSRRFTDTYLILITRHKSARFWKLEFNGMRNGKFSKTY